MSVHKAISKHVNTQNAILTQYKTLDLKREEAIEEALNLCEQGLPFNTDQINEFTTELNKLSKKIQNLPTRKVVTTEMVREYANRRK